MYNAVTDEYKFRDKYYGRDITEDGFRDSLREFVHNGVRVRVDLLSRLIGMLKELREVICRQDGYRFYSSSLLIMYDGLGFCVVLLGVLSADDHT